MKEEHLANGVAVDAPTDGLGNRSHLAKIDKLRELGIGPHIALPSLVAVGDQSAGKSSVLEGLTGFTFPRAVDLCTRYATQITCRRDKEDNVEITIIPRPGASPALASRLRQFRRSFPDSKAMDLGEVFREANKMMGIRTQKPEDGKLDNRPDLITFSEDILKVEISGPNEQHLTVIDVPGIFRNATPPFTTDSDIKLVRNMVKGYMRDPRTIILAVMPANIDIDTQEILKLAQEADPQGQRTLGVLTKVDLLHEAATKQKVLELIAGKRNKLSLGYYLVMNRGADDNTSSLIERNVAERSEFRKQPWAAHFSTDRLGIFALKSHLSDLLTDISKKEFPSLKLDLAKGLKDRQDMLRLMSQPRGDPASQRAYLIKMSSEFQTIVGCALSAQYTEHPAFQDVENKLITFIGRQNELFGHQMATIGHQFGAMAEKSSSEAGLRAWDQRSLSAAWSDETHEGIKAELDEIINLDPLSFAESESTNIMGQIKQIYEDNRGLEFGTYGPHILSAAFKVQSSRWADLTRHHVSVAIFFVHLFMRSVFKLCCPEESVRSELWEGVILEELRTTYRRAMDRAMYLLKIERECWPSTENHYFNETRNKIRHERDGDPDQKITAQLKARAAAWATRRGDAQVVTVEDAEEIVKGAQRPPRSNVEQTLEDIHDDLMSYYKVARKRYVDAICREVVLWLLLQDSEGPLRIFSPMKMASLSDAQLNDIAGEDAATKRKRRMLTEEIALFEEGVKVARG